MKRMTIHSVALLALVLGICPAFAQEEPAEPDAMAPELPALTEDEALDEPDYAKVAADARAIADDIESREIEQHMTDAGARLQAVNPVTGYPKANDALIDMKEMIKFCESAGGGAGSACKFKLQIKMGLKLGNTLGQLAKGMKPGAGMFGQSGQGSSGMSGGSTPFAMFGPEAMGKRSKASERIGPRKIRNARSAKGEPAPIAGAVEELLTEKDETLQFDAEGGERIMEEYRVLIESYFQKLGEEDPKYE